MLGELGLLASEAQDRRIEELRLGDATAMLAAAIRSAHDRARPARLMVESFGEAVGVRHEVAALPIAGPGSVLLRVLPSTGRAPRLSALTLDQLEALGDGQIFVFDIRRQRMRYLASELAHMIGHSMESPLDLSQIRSLIHVQDREAVEQYFENLGPLGGALVSSVTLRLARPEGGWRWLEVRGRALSLEPDGKARTVLGVAVDITERRTMSLALDRAARAVLRAGEVERRRVVRNLHDSLAQHLVGIDLGLSRLGRHVIPTADTSAITRDIRSALSAAHREVRTYSYLLHPPQLERQGLESALGALLDGFGRRADLAVRMEVSGQPQQVGAEVELALFRVAQEATATRKRAGSRFAWSGRRSG
jgi:PAS domain S-box-containing protein